MDVPVEDSAAATGLDDNKTTESPPLSPVANNLIAAASAAVATKQAQPVSPEQTYSSRRLHRKPSLTRNVEERRRVRQDARVRFRDGEDLTDKCPAREPWKDIVPPSCARVLEMYRAACNKHRIRPLSQAVEFVQSITDFTVRQETFSLKGVKLEARHCEALEEIFRRVYVNVLNLEGCGLEDDGALALLEMVEFYEAAHILILSNNPKLQRQTWLALSRMMKRAAFLHYIDLSQTAVDMNAVPLVGRSLRANCPLVTLHLERNSLSGPRLVILAAALKANTCLAHLYVGDNGLTAEDALMLGAMLKGNRRLELLDIRDNHLLDQGVVLLCQALSTQEHGLTALVLWNNRFTSKSVPAMATMLALHKTLHTLEVGRNRLGNDGMDSLKLGLMRNRSILRLGIMELGLTTTGTIALAEYIGESPVLETVNVRRNNIKLGGLLALARAHKLSQTVTKLDVDTNIKCDQQDQDILKDLAASLEEYSFRNKQLAAERQLKVSQEAEKAQSEAASAGEDVPAGGVVGEAVRLSHAEESESSEKGGVGTNTPPTDTTISDDSETSLSTGGRVNGESDDVFCEGDDVTNAAEQTTAGTAATLLSDPASHDNTESGRDDSGASAVAPADARDVDSQLSAAVKQRQLAAEGLALRAHLEVVDDEEDVTTHSGADGDRSRSSGGAQDGAGDGGNDGIGDDTRSSLKSPQADDSMTFSSELEAALEELHVTPDDAPSLATTDTTVSEGSKAETEETGAQEVPSVSPEVAGHSEEEALAADGCEQLEGDVSEGANNAAEEENEASSL